jgi:hypothetical protein
MGKVSIWAQWLMVASGVLFSPILALFLAWFLGLATFGGYVAARGSARTCSARWGRSAGSEPDALFVYVPQNTFPRAFVRGPQQ